MCGSHEAIVKHFSFNGKGRIGGRWRSSIHSFPRKAPLGGARAPSARILAVGPPLVASYRGKHLRSDHGIDKSHCICRKSGTD